MTNDDLTALTEADIAGALAWASSGQLRRCFNEGLLDKLTDAPWMATPEQAAQHPWEPIRYKPWFRCFYNGQPAYAEAGQDRYWDVDLLRNPWNGPWTLRNMAAANIAWIDLPDTLRQVLPDRRGVPVHVGDLADLYTGPNPAGRYIGTFKVMRIDAARGLIFTDRYADQGRPETPTLTRMLHRRDAPPQTEVVEPPLRHPAVLAQAFNPPGPPAGPSAIPQAIRHGAHPPPPTAPPRRAR